MLHHLVHLWLRQHVTEQVTGEIRARMNRPSPGNAASDPSAMIVSALEIEQAGLIDKGGKLRTIVGHGFTVRETQVGRHELLLLQTGVGQKAAASAVQGALDAYAPPLVMAVGFAGGLQPQLRRGDLVVGNQVSRFVKRNAADSSAQKTASSNESLQVDSLPLPTPFAPTDDSRSSTGANESPPVQVGPLFTVDHIVNEPADKGSLGKQTGALCVDMETYAVAAVCRERGVPFLAVRVISDTVDDRLPRDLDHLIEQKTTASRWGAAFRTVLSRPSAIKDLYKLRETALAAGDKLSEFVLALLDALIPERTLTQESSPREDAGAEAERAP